MNPLSLPANVKPTGDYAVYLVKSTSRRALWHRVDCEALLCDCERATKGESAKAAKLHGYLGYEAMCGHLKAALAYHAMAQIEIERRKRK